MGELAAMTRIVRKISGGLDKVVGYACAALFGAMTLDVLVGVFFRYILNSPLNFTEELARYLMIWGASLAISLGVSAGEHVGLTVILDSLKKPAARKAFSVFINLFVLAFLVFMSVYSIQATVEAKFQMTQSLGGSMVLPKLSVPLAMILAAIQTVLVSLLIVADPEGKLKVPAAGHIDI